MNENEKSVIYNKYRDRYSKGYCTKEQLQKLVRLGLLSQEEYNTIVGENK